jgi:hypothetical protein
MRWSEELRLLEEEMRRVLVFLEWDAKAWRNRTKDLESKWPSIDRAQLEGLAAYGHRQAWIRNCLHDDFTFRWLDARVIFNQSVTYKASPQVSVDSTI